MLFQVDGLRPREPHWYLATLGTDPDRQGKGLGSTLMESMARRIDESGLPAYLESSKERNVSFYARFGFEVVDELRQGIGSDYLAHVAGAPGARPLSGRLLSGADVYAVGSVPVHGHHGVQQFVEGPGGSRR